MRLYSPTKPRNQRAVSSWFSSELSGSARGLFITACCLMFVAGGTYLFSVNKSAVQGYQVRVLEKEMNELKKQNTELKVREAEARALSQVEAGTLLLRMEKVTAPQLLSVSNTVAHR